MVAVRKHLPIRRERPDAAVRAHVPRSRERERVAEGRVRVVGTKTNRGDEQRAEPKQRLPLRLDRGETDATLAHRLGEGLGAGVEGIG